METLQIRDFRPTPTGNFAPQAVLSGTLAASLERLARVAAHALQTPGVLIALLGNDRRCFHAGTLTYSWIAHDPGALVRSGLLRRTVDSGGVMGVRDARDVYDDDQLRTAAMELSLVAVACATFAREDGTLFGVICALDEEPREWTSDELTILTEIGQIAATELQLRAQINDREQREQQLRRNSEHDPLTGLPNRSLFMKRLADATQRCRRGEDGLFAVLFLDLDGFKLVNDSMGHHVGDELLIGVARRLQRCVRGGDIVARLGGDEFAFLLERVADAREAVLIAERVQETLREPFLIGGYQHVSSASIGVALSSGASEQPEYLLRSADIAMYRAKAAGRGRYEMFDQAMHADALTRLQLESDLRQAFDRNEYFVVYQPIVSLRDGRITGLEALVRWRHYERGIVGPATFIPVLEDSGLIVPLGRWLLREACKRARTWKERYGLGDSFTLSVNLSVREFSQKDLVETLRAILDETGFPARQLRLEITESVFISTKHPAVDMVRELRSMGVGIHLDDFGTGYSALSYLHRLPLDGVKLDRTFTSMIDTEERPRQVVQAVVSLAHSIGLEVVAEGVETKPQLEVVRSMGCDLAQGYLFAAPKSPDEVEKLLASDQRW